MKSGRLYLSPTQFTKYINILFYANDSEFSAKFIFINKHMKLCLNIGIVIMAGRSRQSQKNRLLSTTTTLAMGPTQPPFSW
jgi:hypothetical protein